MKEQVRRKQNVSKDRQDKKQEGMAIYFYCCFWGAGTVTGFGLRVSLPV